MPLMPLWNVPRAVFTGSASMVAEAAHSWADTGNEIFLLVARAECGKRLHQLAETAAGHEKILLLFLATHEPKTNARHPGEVEEQNKIIDQLHEFKQKFG